MIYDNNLGNLQPVVLRLGLCSRVQLSLIA